MENRRRIRFNRRLNDGSIYRLGSAVEYTLGWRFFPLVCGKNPSKKYWPTWESCVPRWVGYPDSCESEIVT